jgi:hypothetical protein
MRVMLLLETGVNHHPIALSDGSWRYLVICEKRVNLFLFALALF